MEVPGTRPARPGCRLGQGARPRRQSPPAEVTAVLSPDPLPADASGQGRLAATEITRSGEGHHIHPYVMEESARQRQHELRRWGERYGQLRSRRLWQGRPARRRAGRAAGQHQDPGTPDHQASRSTRVPDAHA
jgi:hypothetical protein